MSMAKVSTYRAPDAITDQRTAHLEREGQDSLDNFIIQAIGKEPYLSFSRPGDSSIQWIQLLHALEQQGSVKKGSRIDHLIEENDSQQHSYSPNSSTSGRHVIKESGNAQKGSGAPARVTKNSLEHVQTLKIPEAVIAFAQAAAKANGEREKYLPGWPLLSSTSKVQLQKCEKCSREFCSQINYRRHIRVHRRSLNADKVSPKNRELLAAFWDKLSLNEAKELVSFEDVTFEEISGSSVMMALGSLMRKPGFSSLPQSYMKAGATLFDVVEGRPSMFPISSQELFSVLDDASEKTFMCAGTAISLQKFVFDGEVGKIATEMRNLVACTSFLLEQKLVKAWLADKDAEALRCQKLLFEEEEAAQKRQAELLERKRMKKLRQKEHKMKENVVVDEPSSEGSRDAAEDASCPMEASCPDMAADDFSLRPNHSAPEDSPQSPFMVSDEMHGAEDGDADRYLDQEVQQESALRQPTPPCQLALKSTRNVFSPLQRPGAMHRPNGHKDPKTASSFTGQKIWTRKSKPQCEDEGAACKERDKETRDGSAAIGGCKVLIGSISVTLKDGKGLHENAPVSQKLFREQNPGSVDSTSADRREDESPETTTDDSPDGVSLSAPEVEQPSAPRLFSSKVAVAFLSQRWKEALSSDHVKLVAPIEAEAMPMGDADLHDESCTEVPDIDVCEESRTGTSSQPPPTDASSHRSQVEDVDVEIAAADSASAVGYRPKFRAKPERSYRLKYIPKQSLTG
ncbi:unnamed protein product [Spirodela intermedia]|uniref:C2H2-type domain-containing protein n=1 Tax=Spirodela intermedia TaxID=51605 RepID=A0A7I8K3E6_SPIIN|nr:unnamed protein product [Spirodela intermedia]